MKELFAAILLAMSVVIVCVVWHHYDQKAGEPSTEAQFQPSGYDKGDHVVLLANCPLRFHDEVYTQGVVGEEFEVADYRADTHRVYLLCKDTNGNLVALNVDEQYVRLKASTMAANTEQDEGTETNTSSSGEASNTSEASDESTPQSPRDAADAYIESLKAQGTVFSSEFQRVLSYNLSPPESEVIYNLDYMSQGGGRLVGPYTITVKRTGDGWHVIGGTPGDRTADLNTDPVIGTNGQWQRSPMEQQIGAAMNGGR